MALIPEPTSLTSGLMGALQDRGVSAADAREARDYAVSVFTALYRIPPDVVARGLDGAPGDILARALPEPNFGLTRLGYDRTSIMRCAYTAFGGHPLACRAIAQAAGYVDAAP